MRRISRKSTNYYIKIYVNTILYIKLKQKSEEILKHNSECTFPEDNNYYEK